MTELSPRQKILKALVKPLPGNEDFVSVDEFNPWDDIIEGIYGGYAGESDRLMIAALEAVRDRQTFEFAKTEGFAGEFMLYVLAGHGMLEYGSSPRGGWPDPAIADLWPQIIEKWKAYNEVVW